jgi:cell division protein FtsB
VRPGIGTADTRNRTQRVVTWILIGGAGVLLINAIVGENGYVATLGLKRAEAALTRTLTLTRIENQRMQDERRRLESSQTALEDAIREQLGFIRPGETAVIVRETPAIPATPPD